MTDLTFCYLHMTRNELLTLDTIDTSEYIKGELSDNGMWYFTIKWNSQIMLPLELEIPPHMIPPNPDDSDSAQVYLPSQVHPSYPYGNPTSVKHPAVMPRIPYDPTSRALFEDMGFAGGGVNGQFRWKELALDQLLPIDEEKEEQKRAAQARKMATGATSNQQQQRGRQPQAQDQGEDDDEEDDEDEDGDDDEEEGENSDEE